MAKFTIQDVSVVLNAGSAFDLSDHCDSVTIEYKKDTPETTAMGTSGYRSRIPGLKDWTITLNLQQDFAAGAVDAALYAGFMATTNPTITIKPTSGAPSATNPSYSGTCIVPSYSPVAGKVGDVAVMQVSLVGSGTLARATS